MIIGKINKNDKIIKLQFEIKCTNCGIHVPGGIKTSEQYFKTSSFNIEIENFRKNYFCGKCRDKKRISGKLD